MSFWRSNSINCYQLIIPRENVHRIVEQLGRLKSIEFKSNPYFAQKPFLPQIKLCQESLHKLSSLQTILTQQQSVFFPTQYTQKQYEMFLQILDRRFRLSNRSNSHNLEKIYQQIQNIWDIHIRLRERMEQLKQQYNKLQEQISIIKAGEILFGTKLYKQSEEDGRSQHRLSFSCGITAKTNEAILRRTLFRMTKGLSIYYSIDIKDINPNQLRPQNNKTGSVAFFNILGFGESKTLTNKMQKLLFNYQINSFQYPKSEEQSIKNKQRINSKLLQNKKLQQLVSIEMKHSVKTLLQVEQNEEKMVLSKLQFYKLYLIHEKNIFQVINQMKLHNNFYETFIFIEADKIETATKQLHTKLINDQMPPPQFIPYPSQDKPTLFPLNSVTTSPYAILSAYGTPHYKEINPAIFNLITFPFMFGVMFSDIAHGLALFAFGILLIRQQGKRSPIIDLLYPHRYIVTLMGFFSFYCGLVYNQFLSMALNIFGSCYRIEEQGISLINDCVYPLGLDPVWSISQNNLNFSNSLKMKIAVIIAIVHMSLGIAIKGLNYWYFKKKIYILIEVLPQLVFFISIFGYMDFLIVFKWLQDWTNFAPSIITTMINIPLELGGTTPCCGGEPMWGTYGQTSQDRIQLFLLFLALISIPVMFAFPLIYECLLLKYRKQREQKNDFNEQLANSNIEQRQSLIQQQVHHAQQGASLKQLAVYRFIQTTQFILGCISNTASYLRLWALSLAHNELSDVFFTQTVKIGIQAGYTGIIYNIILFPIFAAVTFGILICMDSMECFLHTLRLHWVEFQSKFYKGDGRQFKSSNFFMCLNDQLSKKRQLV